MSAMIKRSVRLSARAEYTGGRPAKAVNAAA